jgi:hypothetical protein
MKLTRRAAGGLLLRGLVGFSASMLLSGEAEAANRRQASLRLSESYARKVVRLRDENGDQVFEPVESGKFDLTVRVPLEGINPAAFDEETALTLELEDTLLDLLLGDDPSYRPGRTSAHLLYSDVDDHGVTVVYLNAQLHWSSKELTLRVQGRTPGFQDPILAGFYLDDFTRRFGDTTTAALTLDNTTFYFDVDYGGRVTSRTIVRGPAQEEFDVSSVSLKAKGIPAGVDSLGRRSRRSA